MSESAKGGVVKRYWPVGLAILAVLVGIAVPLLGDGGENDGAARVVERAPLLPREIDPADAPDAVNAPRKTPEQQTRDQIEAHREEVLAKPKGEDAPVLLLAMGNLYRQKLLDYESAADCYKWLIGDYPDAPNITSAYINLGVCYERLGQQQMANRLYREMSEKFPEDSVEHQFARQKLEEH